MAEKHGREASSEADGALGSPTKRGRFQEDHAIDTWDFDIGMSPSTRFGLKELDSAAAEASQPKWDSHFATLISHPTTQAHHKEVYSRLHRHGSASLFQQGSALAPTASLEQLAKDLMLVDMPVETRGSIDSHLRRGSFKNILETLKKETEKQPDGMHPQVELSLEELIAMLQRQEVVRQVPGLPFSLQQKAKLTAAEVQQLEDDFHIAVTEPCQK
eukprot:m.449538 g.449538  ORF g.449538 m.449538 type:complete len:216 (+) comp19838_c0_seq1:99-746(+)